MTEDLERYEEKDLSMQKVSREIALLRNRSYYDLVSARLVYVSEENNNVLQSGPDPNDFLRKASGALSHLFSSVGDYNISITREVDPDELGEMHHFNFIRREVDYDNGITLYGKIDRTATLEVLVKRREVN